MCNNRLFSLNNIMKNKKILNFFILTKNIFLLKIFFSYIIYNMSFPTDTSTQLNYTTASYLPTYSSITNPSILLMMVQVGCIIQQQIQLLYIQVLQQPSLLIQTSVYMVMQQD